jgi:tetratricopeptide (TPR) repeat protein
MYLSNDRNRLRGVLTLAFWLCLPLDLQGQAKGEMTLTTPTKEARALFEQGRDLTENAEIVAARALLDQALAKDPAFAMAHAVRAISGGGFQVQRDHLKQATDLAAKASPAERAWILAVQAQFDGAAAEQGRQITELLKLTPNDKHSRLFAGMYFSGGPADLPTAYNHLRKALDLDPVYGAAFNQLGYLCARMGKYDEAEQAFKRYIAVRPGKPNPHDSYAEFLLNRGRYAESIDQYRMALEALPTFVSAFAGIGHNQVFQGEFTQAREAYQAMFDHANGPADKLGALYWKAISYLHEGSIPAALTTFEERRRLAQAERQYPAEVVSNWSMAFVRMESGNLAACARGLDDTLQSLQASGMSAPLKEVWGSFLKVAKAQVYTKAHAFDAAKSLLEEVRATADRTQDAELHRAVAGTMGMWALEQHHTEEALAYFDKAEQEDPYLWFQQALALEEKGDTAKAAERKNKISTCNLNGLGLAMVRAKAAK